MFTFSQLKEWKQRREAVRRLRQKQDGNRDELSATTMLFFIVGFFCVCHIGYPVAGMISSRFGYVFSSRMYTFMYCVNNAINFLIYCVWGEALKHVLEEIREIRKRFPKLCLWKDDANTRV